MSTARNRAVISLVLCLLCPFVWAEDLKKSVVLVEPEYEEMSAFFSDYALPLSRMGFRWESRAMMALNSGVSGSGVVAQRGDSLVVMTNRHVVGFAHAVTVKVQDGKSWITYEHCPVMAVSPLTDIAMVSLPDSSDLVALPLCAVPVHDAEEVWAAGFPGLGDEPSWQVTKGIISNSELYREELLGRQQAAIQHTAPIDAGSSGGPLLRKDSADRFVVVGLNTWKAGYRDGVGIAIPLGTLQHFLQYGNEQEEKTDAMRTEEWNMLLREDYIQAAEALSVDYLMTRTAADWETVFEAMGYTNQKYLYDLDRTDVLDILRLTWAFDAMRFAMAGGENAHFDIVWGDVQGRRQIVELIYPELTKKQYMEATKRIRK